LFELEAAMGEAQHHDAVSGMVYNNCQISRTL
jgi:hypothetical protein